MKVRCISRSLNEEQCSKLRVINPPEYQIVIGGTYLVLGLTMMTDSEPHGGGVHYQILNDYGAIRSIPSLLFEIVDSRCSQFWNAQAHEDGSLMMWPREFFTRYFHDDLSEGIQEIVEIFKDVVKRLSTEFD